MKIHCVFHLHQRKGKRQSTDHFIFRHSEAASLGTWNWFLWVVLALLEVVREAVQLHHGGAAVQLIVAPGEIFINTK